jgi:hypothetical protein
MSGRARTQTECSFRVVAALSGFDLILASDGERASETTLGIRPAWGDEP